MPSSPLVNVTVLIPGPSFHVDLAGLDARHPVHYSRRLLIFRCSSSSQRADQLAALEVGLKALLQQCPLLGGVISTLPPNMPNDNQVTGDDWFTVLPDKGMELVIRDMREAMPSFAELEAADYASCKLPYDLLVPVPVDVNNDRPFAACRMQYSAIEGGAVLAWAMSHSVADGSGHNELICVLAEEIRRAKDHPTPITTPLGQDRSLLRSITSEVPFNVDDHPAYRETPPPPDPPQSNDPSPHPFLATSPETPVTLHISATSLSKLKADATSPTSSQISTHDALAALTWRSIVLCRSRRSPAAHDVQPSTKTTLFMPSDARRHLPLPQPYVGNAVYQLTASLPLETLLSHSGLAAAASAIRSAITSVKPELVVSYMVQLRKEWVDWQFLDGTCATTSVAMGTDWTSGAMYAEDWGESFGNMVRFRYPGEEGLNAIMPKCLDGGADVVVSVMESEVEVLRGERGVWEVFGVR